MRPLVIDDAAQAKVKRVVDYATRKERWLRPVGDYRIPGDNPNLRVDLNTFHCVFTITVAPEGLFRHLTISVPSDLLPNPFAAYTIAQLFGFTGWNERSFDLPKGWISAVNREDNCIVLAQPYEESKVTA